MLRIRRHGLASPASSTKANRFDKKTTKTTKIDRDDGDVEPSSNFCSTVDDFGARRRFTERLEQIHVKTITKLQDCPIE